ncbi:hypothetical protein VTP01DRAFT_8161 [Rhizomucor pusillus]|uniref:uncharacterized protein n=1 Tax=Rhizomucor pusillus TaxID=4840 RepID=UPI003744A6F2
MTDGAARALAHLKDPPSYDAIAVPIPESHQQPLQRRQPCQFLQECLVAILVAASVSVIVMLLLWQMQNPPTPGDHPWFDPD